MINPGPALPMLTITLPTVACGGPFWVIQLRCLVTTWKKTSTNAQEKKAKAQTV